MKIDVQGFECNVLRGGIQTTACTVPASIENDHERPCDQCILLPEGYRRAPFENGRFVHDKVGPLNTFYIPAEKTEQIQAAYR